MMNESEIQRLLRQVRQQAESLQRAGVRYTERIEPQARVGHGGPTQQQAEPEKLLLELAREVAGCTRCPELVANRTQTVFGVGNPRAQLCFVGEAPGGEEDALGEPFVGAAGQLLTRIIAAMGLKRSDVYICNVLKCRPPGNRTPAPDEMCNCRGYLDHQLEIIRPRFICALGAVAAQTLLENTQSIGRLRGRFHQYRGIPVVCTYHPAYLLRTPSAKKAVWEDVQMIMREMQLHPAG